MSNNMICDFIGIIGTGIAFICFLCYFFGIAFGLWGTFIGIGMMGLALVNYD